MQPSNSSRKEALYPSKSHPVDKLSLFKVYSKDFQSHCCTSAEFSLSKDHKSPSTAHQQQIGDTAIAKAIDSTPTTMAVAQQQALAPPSKASQNPASAASLNGSVSSTMFVFPRDSCPEPDDLFSKRKRLVQQTWRAVDFGLDVKTTERFYERLFEAYPSVIPMFQYTDMDLQARKLYDVVKAAVSLLDDVDTLLPILKEMGVRHAKAYGVKRAHYHAVTLVLTEVLLDYVSEKMPSRFAVGSCARWSIEVSDAWNWVLTLVGTTMADAADEALRDKEGV